MSKARFWFFWNASWVKLTLQERDPSKDDDEDNSIVLSSSEPNDEGGYFAIYETLWLQDGKVHRRTETSSRDCDGPMTSSERMSCDVDKLASKRPYADNDPIYCPVPGARLPAWQKEGYSQRDYFAEAAGY